MQPNKTQLYQFLTQSSWMCQEGEVTARAQKALGSILLPSLTHTATTTATTTITSSSSKSEISEQLSFYQQNMKTLEELCSTPQKVRVSNFKMPEAVEKTIQVLMENYQSAIKISLPINVEKTKKGYDGLKRPEKTLLSLQEGKGHYLIKLSVPAGYFSEKMILEILTRFNEGICVDGCSKYLKPEHVIGTMQYKYLLPWQENQKNGQVDLELQKTDPRMLVLSFNPKEITKQ